MCLRTRGIVRLISYFTALVLVLSGFLYRAAAEKEALQETRRREARRAYQELLASLEEMDAALLKFSASSSPSMLVSLA
ncbi:MAG: hypothetical protein J5849_04950, partial [Clostridia bacterium]|nr:hypothetical protein [Clostridia bacterium]